MAHHRTLRQRRNCVKFLNNFCRGCVRGHLPTVAKAVAELSAAAHSANFNKQNPAGIAALYAQDGILVNASGVIAAPSGIEEAFGNALKAGFNRQEIVVHDAFSPAPDVVVGRGEYANTGQGPNGALQVHGRWTCVYVRQGGALKIRVLTAFALPAPK